MQNRFTAHLNNNNAPNNMCQLFYRWMVIYEVLSCSVSYTTQTFLTTITDIFSENSENENMFISPI